MRLLCAALLLSVQPTVSADSCSDLSEQNFTGQLPATITRLRLLSSMCARDESCYEPHAEPKWSHSQPRSGSVLSLSSARLSRLPEGVWSRCRGCIVGEARPRARSRAPQCRRCFPARRSQRVVRRNFTRNALTGRFPAFVFSMPSIAALYVAHARSLSLPLLGTDGGLPGCLAIIVLPACCPPTSRRCRHCGSCTPLSVVLGCGLRLRFHRTCLQERHVQLARRRRLRDSADERHCVFPPLPHLACQLLPPLSKPTPQAASKRNHD